MPWSDWPAVCRDRLLAVIARVFDEFSPDAETIHRLDHLEVRLAPFAGAASVEQIEARLAEALRLALQDSLRGPGGRAKSHPVPRATADLEALDCYLRQGMLPEGAEAPGFRLEERLLALATHHPRPIAQRLIADAFARVGACVLVGAGTWAQWLEGSSHLLRPFGWYGGVVGAVVGTTTVALAGVPVLPLMASYACAAPFIQAWGRLRCLVNGCCHGGPTPVTLGIRYTHRRSRVTRVAGLPNQPLHPTPLYSIATNLFLGAALLRLRALGAADVLVLGLYLILSGIARFVKESYRAEPQTRIIAGLHLYQWLAFVQAAAGIVTTTLPATPRAAGFVAPTPLLLASAVVMALLSGAALGVDFPRSNRPYSRLADAD